MRRNAEQPAAGPSSKVLPEGLPRHCRNQAASRAGAPGNTPRRQADLSRGGGVVKVALKGSVVVTIKPSETIGTLSHLLRDKRIARLS